MGNGQEIIRTSPYVQEIFSSFKPGTQLAQERKKQLQICSCTVCPPVWCGWRVGMRVGGVKAVGILQQRGRFLGDPAHKCFASQLY